MTKVYIEFKIKMKINQKLTAKTIDNNQEWTIVCSSNKTEDNSKPRSILNSISVSIAHFYLLGLNYYLLLFNFLQNTVVVIV